MNIPNGPGASPGPGTTAHLAAAAHPGGQLLLAR
jgi:hypothetical protein